MKKSKVIGFNPSKMAAEIMANAVAEQNRRLVEYAKEKIAEIGNKINTYNSRNHMDRTGNLLDSLCWGLSYRGKMVEYGFYREQKASELSYLHEWFHDNAEPVGGHVLANQFIKQMANLNYGGWRLFFAILAPYWGYWETGFTFKGAKGQKFLQFQVMTEFYDVVANDLKPAKVKFTVKLPPTYTKESWRKKADKRDTREARGGHSLYDKYKGKYNF